jgi:hypothetical protein
MLPSFINTNMFEDSAMIFGTFWRALQADLHVFIRIPSTKIWGDFRAQLTS